MPLTNKLIITLTACFILASCGTNTTDIYDGYSANTWSSTEIPGNNINGIEEAIENAIIAEDDDNTNYIPSPTTSQEPESEIVVSSAPEPKPAIDNASINTESITEPKPSTTPESPLASSLDPQQQQGPATEQEPLPALANQPEPEAVQEPSPYTVNATISWQEPQQRQDGEMLIAEDIANYEIAYTDPTGELNTQRIPGGTNSWTTTMGEGNYQFAISATDKYGLTSSLSNTITCNIHPNLSHCR